jgi:hypothetical protein
MLRQMSNDIDAAKRLPASFAEYETNDKVLLIELDDGVICYQLADGEVHRRRLTDTRQDRAKDATIWSGPNAAVEWLLWKEDDKGYAVEIRTYLNCVTGGRSEKKMANAHVYFLNSLQETEK